VPAPRFVIVAGSNGSGKSSVGSRWVTSTWNAIVPLNPDAISARYEAEYPAWPRDAANLTGVIETERRVWSAIASGRSVGVETVFSTNKYFSAVDAARLRGYETILVYVGLPSVEVAVARVASRVELGGHDVPAAKIRSRWNASWDHCVDAIPIVDRAYVWWNGGSGRETALVGWREDRKAPFILDRPELLPPLTKRLTAL
jgi:predicted ABC-type ATPase